MEENIIFINSSYHHPQTNGVVESFNKTIIKKLDYLLMDKNNNLNIREALDKAEYIYNNTIHTSLKRNL
jgi:transposase InsO family protein